MKKTVFCIFAFFLFAQTAQASSIEQLFEVSPVFQSIWKNVNEISERAGNVPILPKRNERTTLQKLLGHDSKYGRILKDARDTLTRGVADPIFQSIDKLQSRNNELNKKASQLKRARVTAPVESANPFAETKASIDEQINVKIPRELQANTEEIGRLKQEAIEELKKAGVSLEPYQLEYFLVSAEGEELLKLVTMAGNMKNLQQLLEQQMSREKNNIELARQYTGMHLISLDAYVYALETACENLTEYRKRLGPIIDEANRTIDEARKLLAQAGSGDRKGLEGNIRINMRIIAVANAYEKLLDRRLQNLEQSRQYAMYKADVARNAYTTIVNGGNLITLIQKGEQDFDLVMNFTMPELKTIYEPVMMNAFAEISAKIKNPD